MALLWAVALDQTDHSLTHSAVTDPLVISLADYYQRGHDSSWVHWRQCADWCRGLKNLNLLHSLFVYDMLALITYVFKSQQKTSNCTWFDQIKVVHQPLNLFTYSNPIHNLSGSDSKLELCHLVRWVWLSSEVLMNGMNESRMVYFILIGDIC